MEENSSKRFKRYRLPMFIIGILVVAASAVLIARALSKNVSLVQVDLPPPDTSGEGEVSAAGLGSSDAHLIINLSPGQAQPEATEQIASVTGEPLTEEEITRILERLTAMAEGEGDQVDFNLPQESLPPPRTGETISETFPPPSESAGPGTVEAGPLEVLRFAPEGEIPLAPFINVTFNQPMVPLASLEDLATKDVPVQVDPPLPGTWRWVGTKTLTFQYDSSLIDRLPMATEYQITIPSGTESATGGVLAEAVVWSFSTPPPKITSKLPYDTPQPRDPIIFIAFDQRIDSEALMEIIQVTADGESYAIRMATEAEIKEDKTISRFIEHTPQGRWIAFRAEELLPADSSIRVSVPAGTPSAEGPLVTTEEQSFSFRTYAPLRIVDHGCSWSGDRCPPLTPFFIRFNNPIDLDAMEESLLKIEPELPGASVNIFGDTIQISGATQGQTTYRVTVDGDILDVFGQTLGKEQTLSFKVGTAEPFLVGPERILVTIDPAASEPILSLYTVNYNRLDLKIYAVEPGDWPTFQAYLREYQRTDSPPAPPGRLVRDESMRLETPTDKLTEVGIDLSRVMDGDYGQFIVIAKPDRGLFQNNDDRYWETVQVWVQVTQIGLDAFADQSRMVVWTSALQDGAPLSGVTIESDSVGISATTGEDGVARFELTDESASYLVAKKGADKVLLPRSDYYWGDSYWQRQTVYDELRWYVFDDRQMYRPNEEVHVKGWLRRLGGKPDGDVGLVGDAVSQVRYRVIDPQGNEVGSGESQVNALGGFDFVFSLPENANLGYANLQLEALGTQDGLENRQYYHQFQIQEFRRPEFEVTARNETVGPYFVGEHAIVAVEAKYYAGGPLPNADVTWQVSSSPSNYEPPNWEEFVFGIWEPWWWYYEPAYYGEPYWAEYETFTGTTDATGNHYLRLDFEAVDKPRPISVLAEATVMDVNRQAWAGTTSLLVHPADLYVGLRSDRTFVERGTPLEINLIVTDLDGKPVVDRPIDVTAARLEWKYRNGKWGEEEVDVQECTAGSQTEPVSCTFETPLGGRYRITALVSDSQGRQNMSQFIRWVSGGQLPPSRQVEQESVTLIPDKESYQPGDTARILVQAPFSPAEGLLTVSRSGILYTERFSIEEGSATLEVPIEDGHIPNLNIQVDVVGSAPRTGDQGEALEDVPARPAYASGQLTLNIPPMARTLTLEATPREAELEPGGETTIDVSLIDAQGEPVAGAELAVVVVDEAILALSNYQLTDPLAVFFSPRPSNLYSTYSRASIVLTDPQRLLQAAQAGGEQLLSKVVEEVEGEALRAQPTSVAAMEAPAADMGMAQTQPEPIRVRTDFNPLAVFAPDIHTDSNGEAQIAVELPDNLTRYRVMVVAVDAGGTKFGSAQANLTARLPLMVRPSAPRFLNFGDSFELPVILQNQTDEPLVTEVVIQTSNLILSGDSGLRVTIPANDRVEVRFPATTDMAGTARFQIAAVSGAYADAAEVELPVFTPATTEAFATYGVVDEGAIAQPVASPGGVFPQFGGLEISTSSTALQALTDAVLYLVSYPFECSEQLASRILAVAALRDVLSAFSAEGLPSPEEIESRVVSDIDKLEKLQNSDGGFPYWRRGRDSIPFNTVHVAHALQKSEMMGFEVPQDMRVRVLGYLQDIEDHYPSWYSKRVRWTISAYALYVRDMMGDPDPNKASRLLDEAGVEELPLEASAWLWQVLLDTSGSASQIEAIQRHIGNRAVETAAAANFTTSYGDDDYVLLHSNRRTDAVILDAMIAGDPNSDLIPKVVNGLLAHRVHGRWNSTQENVFVLLALDHYFKTFEVQTPDFVARIWLGETYAGEHRYAGRTTERHETEIPMTYLVEESPGDGETQDLILSKEGTGRLYYRLGLRYAPTDLTLEPLDMGFVVQRIYEAVDDPEDVYQDEEGTWHIKAGTRIRVRLTMVADNRRYHVALVDPLPAGLEIVNPALTVSESIPQDPEGPDYRYGWWWWGPWYEHQKMRDERAEAFTPLLWEGVYQYTYITRATTPGKYVVPPAKVEEMYSPEVFGRSGTDWVIVE